MIGSLEEGVVFFTLVGVFLFSLLVLYIGFDIWKKTHMIRNTPTERVRSIAAGRTELEGLVRPHGDVIYPPRVRNGCVFVKWKFQTGSNDEDAIWKWNTIESGRECTSFILDDGTGQVVVEMGDDEMPFVYVERDENEYEILFDADEPADDDVVMFVQQMTGRNRVHPTYRDSIPRRFVQSVIPIEGDGYVFGEAQNRGAEAEIVDGEEDLLKMTRDKGTNRFIIADCSADELKSGLRRDIPIILLMGFVGSLLSLYVLLNWFIL